MMNMLTLKQAADSLGISKDKLKYRVGKLPASAVNRTRGITYVTDEGMRLLQAFYAGEKSGEPGNSPGELPTRYIETLERELEAKNRQLDAATAQISDLTAALVSAQQSAAAAQALHAATMKQNLEDGNLVQRERGIFARLFGKRKD